MRPAARTSTVGGPVTRDTSLSLDWLDDVLDPRGAVLLREWLAEPTLTPASKSERLSVRIAMHLGDVAPPVNSQYAGWWNSDTPQDWGGWAVAAALAAQTETLR